MHNTSTTRQIPARYAVRRRRCTVLSVLAVAAAVGLSACSSGGDSSDTDSIVFGQWNAGQVSVTSLTAHNLAENEELQQKYGLDVDFQEYTNLQALYTDLARGRVDAVVGAPDSFASSAAQGAPIRLLGSFSRSNAVIVSRGEPLTADTLRGRRMAAATSTGTWTSVRQQIFERTGLVADQDYQVVTAESPSAAIQQVAAGTADFAMGWGESLVDAMHKFPNITIAASAQDLAGDNMPFIQFVIGGNSDRIDQSTGEALVSAFAEQAEWITSHADEVDAQAVAGGRAPGVAKEHIVTGDISFDIKPFPGPEGDELKASMEQMQQSGVIKQVPADAFFGTGA